MHSPMLPLREKLPDGGPGSVMALIGDIVAAAVVANVDDIHPGDLDLGPDGRVVLVQQAQGPSPAAAPELARTGPTPATMVFSAAAIGVIAALGGMEPAPSTRIAHQQWLEDVMAQLFDQWGEGAEAQQALDWLGRCLAFDQFSRPAEDEVMEALLLHPLPEELTPVATSQSLSMTSAHTGTSPAGVTGHSGVTGHGALGGHSGVTGQSGNTSHTGLHPHNTPGTAPSMIIGAPQRSVEPWFPVAMAAAVALMAFALATCTFGTVVGRWMSGGQDTEQRVGAP